MTFRPNLLFFIVAIGLMLTSCSGIIYTSSWQGTDIRKINPEEKKEPFRFHDEKSNIQYNISNDSANLYVLLKTQDFNEQFRIITNGLKLWIDTVRRKKNHFGIIYPLPIEYQEDEGNLKNPLLKHSIFSKLKKQVLTDSFNIKILGLRNRADTIISRNNRFGLSASVDWDSSGTMYYCAIIPFKVFFRNKITDKDFNQVFYFKVNLDPLPGRFRQEETISPREKAILESSGENNGVTGSSTMGQRQSFENGKGSYGVRDAIGSNYQSNTISMENQGNRESYGNRESQKKAAPSPFDEISHSIKFKLALSVNHHNFDLK